MEDPQQRLAISRFIDRYRLENFFVVSSQKPYVDFFTYTYRNFPEKCQSWRVVFEADLGAAFLKEDERFLTPTND